MFLFLFKTLYPITKSFAFFNVIPSNMYSCYGNQNCALLTTFREAPL